MANWPKYLGYLKKNSYRVFLVRVLHCQVELAQNGQVDEGEKVGRSSATPTKFFNLQYSWHYVIPGFIFM